MPSTCFILSNGKPLSHVISATWHLPVWHGWGYITCRFSLPYQSHTASDLRVMTVVMIMPNTQTDSGIQNELMNWPV